VALSALMDIAT